MNEVPHQTDSAIRLARLATYRIMDTNADTVFDRVARIAALSLDTPMAAVGFLDGSRVWFKASVGIEGSNLPRIATTCAEWQDTHAPVIIADPGMGQAPKALPAFGSAADIGFYSGVPLRAHNGAHLGFLCVMDTLPRARPTDSQIGMLTELAALVVGEMELTASPQIAADTTGRTERQTVPAEGAHRNLLAAYAAKSEFLSSLSHELRTPLNAIVGYAGLIAGSDDTLPATADHAGEITAAARHMLVLVNDILEYSRLEAGNLPIGWQRVMVGPIVEAALHMVAVFASSRGITLTRELVWADAAVRGDPVRLKQVLLNLLTNAIKFTPRGGRVTVNLRPSPDGNVELAVIDTGIGIAEDDIQKTLIPFGQIVPKGGTHTEGTGLGLPIAKALIERQGGTLSLESHLGQGTTVRIQLPPLHPAPAPLHPAPVGGSAHALHQMDDTADG